MAGELGADPRPIVLETIRLPLSYSPIIEADRLELSITLCYAPILAYFPRYEHSEIPLLYPASSSR
jgi:hypothetical protein